MNLTPRTLISATELRALQQQDTSLVLLDCGFELTDPAAGERAHAQGHLPGAIYAHLERDLSGPKQDPDGVFRGRHPLPDRAAFATTVARWGITPRSPVVAYDTHGGPYAARAWWLLRWLGHADVAVLDGGTAAWREAGGGFESTVSRPAQAPPYPPAAAAMPTIDAAALQRGLGRLRVVDARAGERFRGEVEPLDQAAGHIPGAINRFFKHNLQADGRFKPVAELEAEWHTLLAPFAADAVVQQCGSGVTACHNLLALEHAGLGTTTLYPGSWSEWSADPARPVARA
jgi:thiosulfate/3-mercaptopyruvate sulfurtransferase